MYLNNQAMETESQDKLVTIPGYGSLTLGQLHEAIEDLLFNMCALAKCQNYGQIYQTIYKNGVLHALLSHVQKEVV